MSVTKKEMKDALINVRAACALSAGHPPIPCSKCLNSNCNIKLNALSRLIEHGPEVSRECIEYLTKIEKRTRDIIEWLEEPWDDPNAVIDEMTIRLKRLLQDTMGRR